jgi:RNA ligase.
MKYDTIKNPNYVAAVIRVAALADLEGLDNLKGIQIFGMQALVSKDVKVGDVGVLFSTEVQLSEDFARENNLHRHTNLNADPTVETGYLEDSRRVKAIKLRGHRSDSLFVSLDAFKYLKVKPEDFKVGDVFDSINGHEILRKYQIKEPGVNKGPQAKIRRVDLKVFPLHVDSENYWRNMEKVPEQAPVVVTQKLHGTSVRYGNVPVADDLTLFQRIKKRLGLKVGTPNSYKFVVGSRMVVKSIDYEAASAGKQHFYAEDLWTRYAKDHKLDELIPEGYLVYGELIGYTPDGKPIQKDYTYSQDDRTAELYVYRVATVTPSGVVTDLSWPATKAFAQGIGLKTVPELFTLMHRDFTANDWIDRRFYDEFLSQTDGNYLADTPVPLSGGKNLVDEGVCVRYDGPNGIYILKAKSPIFLGHESAMLDEGGDDVEAEEAA